MDKLETSNAEHWIDELGILHKKIKNNVHVEIGSIRLNTEKLKKFTGGKKMLVLYHATVHFTLTDEVMEFLCDESFTKNNIATAIVSEKIGVRITADYMVRIKKLKTPLQVFNTEKEAIKWLLTLKKKPVKKHSV